MDLECVVFKYMVRSARTLLFTYILVLILTNTCVQSNSHGYHVVQPSCSKINSSICKEWEPKECWDGYLKRKVWKLVCQSYDIKCCPGYQGPNCEEEVSCTELTRADDSEKILKLQKQIELLLEARERDLKAHKQDRLELQELKKRMANSTALCGKHGISTKQAFASNGVGFTACVGVEDLLNLGTNQIVVFDRITTNAGGAYHNTTGVFTAPLPSLYAFHLSVMNKPGQAMYFVLVNDGKSIDAVLDDGHGDSSWESSSEMWVLQLNQGSEVWIQTKSTGEVHGNCHTMFSGFLIAEAKI